MLQKIARDKFNIFYIFFFFLLFFKRAFKYYYNIHIYNKYIINVVIQKT
jgi:hypothetical protein